MGIRWGQPNPPKAGLGLGWGSLPGGYLMSSHHEWAIAYHPACQWTRSDHCRCGLWLPNPGWIYHKWWGWLPSECWLTLKKTLVTANTPWIAMLLTWLMFCTAEDAGTSTIKVDGGDGSWVVVFCQGGSWASFCITLNVYSSLWILCFCMNLAWIPASGCQFRGHFKSTI